MSHFNAREVAEVRSQIGGLKSRYGDVGSHAEDARDEHMFGKSDSARGMHRTTQEFTDHLRSQYDHAERVLGDVERALDATEQDHMRAEQVNAEQFEHWDAEQFEHWDAEQFEHWDFESWDSGER